MLHRCADLEYGLVGWNGTGLYVSLSFLVYSGISSSSIIWHGLTNPCCFSLYPHCNTKVLYWFIFCKPLRLWPSWNIWLISSLCILFCLTVTKKSIVLNSGGFHLNEYFQGILLFGPGGPPNSVPPTANAAGVKIKPSVLYSKSPSALSVNIFEHPSNILVLLLS